MADCSDEIRVISCGACTSIGKSTNAVIFCEQCEQGLCPECQRDHQKFPAMWEHTMHTITDRAPPQVQTVYYQTPQLLRCDYHDAKCVEYFCNNHAELHCSLCRHVNHANCNTKYISNDISGTLPSNELDFALAALEQLSIDFAKAKGERQSQVEEMIRMKQLSLEEVRNLKERLERLFHQLDLKAAQNVSDVDKCVDDFREKVMLYEDAIVHVSTLTNQLKSVHGSDDPLTIFVARTKVQKLKADFTMLLEQNQNDVVPLRLIFNQDPHVTDILLTCESLGEVGTVTLPHLPLQTNRQNNVTSSNDMLNLLLGKKAEDVPHITSKLAKGPAIVKDVRAQGLSSSHINQTRMPAQTSIPSSMTLDSAYSENSSLSSFRNSPVEFSPTTFQDNNAFNARTGIPDDVSLTVDPRIPIENIKSQHESTFNPNQDTSVPDMPNKTLYLDSKKNNQSVGESFTTRKPTWAAIAQNSPINSKESIRKNKPVINSKTFKNIRLKSRKKYDVSLQNENGDCDITGSTFLPDGSLVLCDHFHKTVKVFSHTFKLAHSKRLEDHPWDVAPVDKDEIVVTLTKSKVVQYIVISSDGFTYSSKFKTKQMCWGIESMNEHIIICCHDNPGNGIVEVRTRQGQVIHKISVDAEGDPIFVSPFYVTYDGEKDLAYITDGKNSSVICASFRNNAVLYNTKMEYLRWPKGILVDQDSHLLTSAHFIDQLKLLTGKCAMECVTFCDAIRPQSLSFRWDDLVMVVTTAQGQKITAYQFEYK